APTALVAQPALFDRVVRVVATGHALDLARPRRQLGVATDRTQTTHRRGVGDVPGPRNEAVGNARQGAHRTNVGDVAAKARLVGVPGEGGDLAPGSAVLHGQLPILGDILTKPDTAKATDAALPVERDPTRQLEWLREVPLGLDEPRLPG